MPRIIIIITAAVLMLVAPVALAEEGPRHPPARKAIARADQEIRKAETVYRQELLRIQKALVSELERAKADAMQRQLLDEAVLIQAKIEEAQSNAATPAPISERLRDTTWAWPVPDSSGKATAVHFGADNTVRTTWHNEVGVWAVTSDGQVVAKVTAGGGPTYLRVSDDLRTMTREDGKQLIRQ